MGDVRRGVPPYGAVMTTASVGTRQVARLTLAFIRLGALLAFVAVSFAMWWAFAQVILRVIA